MAVGGTAGHIYPSLALAKKLNVSGHETIFAGHGLTNSRYFDKEPYELYNFESSTITFKKPWKLPFQLWKILKGTLAALKFLKQQPVQLIVGFGSYHSLPLLLASLVSKEPFVLFESNRALGKINRLFAKKALFTAYQLFDLEAYFEGKYIKVSPLGFHEHSLDMTKNEAKLTLGLEKDLVTVLVFGGSSGALSLNKLWLNTIKKISGKTFQVIHLVGNKESQETIETVYKTLGVKALVKKFLSEMNLAYRAADLLICRSGALSVYEQNSHKVPAILLPLPWASENHQLKNAKYAQKHLGGVLVEDQNNPQKFQNVLESLLDSQKRLEFLRNSIKPLDQLETLKPLNQLITEMITK